MCSFLRNIKDGFKNHFNCLIIFLVICNKGQDFGKAPESEKGVLTTVTLRTFSAIWKAI